MSTNAAVEIAAARAVCRACSADVNALDHVVASISEMLDTTRAWKLEEAAVKGYARLVERILSREIQNDVAIQRALGCAASRGHLAVVQTLVKGRPACKVTPAMEDAAIAGHLPVLRWLHENAASARTQRMTLDAMDSAAVNGHLDVLQWLHDNRQESCTTRAMDGAARAGRLEIVQWLHAHRREGCTTQAMDGAATNGHLEVLAWLHEHRHEGCSSLAMSAALQKGHVHVVAWLERIDRENEKPLVTWHEKWPTRHTVHAEVMSIPIRSE
jgi:hypothetical protein